MRTFWVTAKHPTLEEDIPARCQRAAHICCLLRARGEATLSSSCSCLNVGLCTLAPVSTADLTSLPLR